MNVCLDTMNIDVTKIEAAIIERDEGRHRTPKRAQLVTSIMETGYRLGLKVAEYNAQGERRSTDISELSMISITTTYMRLRMFYLLVNRYRLEGC